MKPVVRRSYLYEISFVSKRTGGGNGKKTLVRENILSHGGRTVLTTDLVKIEAGGLLSVPYSYEMVMVGDKIVSMSRCRKKFVNNRDAVMITRYYFQDDGKCLVKSFRNVSGKIRYRRKLVRNRPFDLLGMFHYYFLFNPAMGVLLRQALQGKPVDRDLDCLEINPFNDNLMHWVLRLEKARKTGSDYLIRFRVVPGPLIRFLFALLRVNPRIDFHMNHDRRTFTRFNEFSITGQRVVYRLVSDPELSVRIRNSRAVF